MENQIILLTKEDPETLAILLQVMKPEDIDLLLSLLEEHKRLKTEYHILNVDKLLSDAGSNLRKYIDY